MKCFNKINLFLGFFGSEVCLGVCEAHFIILESNEPNRLRTTVLIGLTPDWNTSLTGSLRADTDEVFDASDALLGVESVDDVDFVAN